MFTVICLLKIIYSLAFDIKVVLSYPILHISRIIRNFFLSKLFCNFVKLTRQFELLVANSNSMGSIEECLVLIKFLKATLIGLTKNQIFLAI